MEILNYQEWLKSEEGYETGAAILAASSSMYPDKFQIDRQLRLAYEDYKKRKANESTTEH
jgi:hypothetical protein